MSLSISNSKSYLKNTPISDKKKNLYYNTSN